jgi:acetoin utilization deacetylase AcuC-like enzyme
MGRTAYVYDPRFLLHDLGVDAIVLPSGALLDPESHPSSVRILRRTAQLIANSGLPNELIPLPARSCALADLELVHHRGYIDHVRSAVERGAMPHEGLPAAEGTWAAALLAAGTSIALVDAVLDGIVTAGFGLVRPPGHHATPDHGTGYSIFNNVAIGAAHAIRRRGAARVAIVDWDVHHGSGTQGIFWDDPDVLAVSVHQERWFPASSGAADELGAASAAGRIVNVPLPAGTGDRGHVLAFEQVVVPALRAFRPELVIIAAGQDGSLVDPLGRMSLTTHGYRQIASRVRAVADEVCGGRVVVLQEGGYSPSYTPFCTLAVLEGVVGVRTEVGDPLAGWSQHEQAVHELLPRAEHAVAAVRALHAPRWEMEDST